MTLEATGAAASFPSVAKEGTQPVKRRRTWPQRLLIAFNCLLVVACLAAAAGLAQVKGKLQDVKTVSIDPASAQPVAASEPRNILIVGTDSGKGLDPDDPILNGRKGENLADVIMVLRVDPEAQTAKVISIPRDSRLELAPNGSMGRINASLQGPDGPKNLADTIRNNFGISIDNYMEIDFASFKQLVEQLNGVPVYFASPVRDRKTGLLIEEAGCHHLSPDQALAYARSREFQYQDEGTWRYDRTGDLGRISRQQDFMKRAIRRASELGLRNPSTALGVVNAGVDAVWLDETLSVGTILDLLEVFRRFNPDELATEQIPTIGAPRGGISYQDVVWDEALPMLEPFWGVRFGEEIENSDVIVNVEAPSSDHELVGLVSLRLNELLFDSSPRSSRYKQDRTTITYGSNGFPSALLLARHMEGPVQLDYDDGIVGPRVVLSVGNDFVGILGEPVPEDQLPPELSVPPPELQEALNEAASTTTVLTDSVGNQIDPETGEIVPPETTTTEPSPEALDFIDSSELEGAPPGIVPTDAKLSALCH